MQKRRIPQTQIQIQMIQKNEEKTVGISEKIPKVTKSEKVKLIVKLFKN
jgi:hypothetical protein